MEIEDVQPYFTEDEEQYQIPYDCLFDYEDQNASFQEQNRKIASDSKNFSTTFPKEKQNLISHDLHTPETSQSLPNKSTQNKNQFQNQQSEKFVLKSFVEEKENEKDKQACQLIALKYNIQKRKKIGKKMEILMKSEMMAQQTRQIKLQRYRQKKLKRNWQRGILYEERKKLAYKRVRLQGRFQGKCKLVFEKIEQKKSQDSIYQELKQEEKAAI